MCKRTLKHVRILKDPCETTVGEEVGVGGERQRENSKTATRQQLSRQLKAVNVGVLINFK